MGVENPKFAVQTHSLMSLFSHFLSDHKQTTEPFWLALFFLTWKLGIVYIFLPVEVFEISLMEKQWELQRYINLGT